MAFGIMIILIFLPRYVNKELFAFDLRYWTRKIPLKNNKVWILIIPIIIVVILLAGVFSEPKVAEKQITRVYGSPVMIIVDVSSSMGVGYTNNTGYDNAYNAFSQLVAERGDVNFGLLLFSEENYIARYFTNKNELFKDSLENEEEILDFATSTNVVDALKTARFFITNNLAGINTAIILISDLDFTKDQWREAILELVLISLDDIDTYVIATGNGFAFKNNFPELSNLKVFDSMESDSIHWIYKELALMKLVPIMEEEDFEKKSIVPFFTIPALIMIIVCIILSETLFRKIP
jgi:hypothetical protein